MKTDAEVEELFDAVNQLIEEREYKSGVCVALINGVWYEGEAAEKAIAGHWEKMKI